MQLLVSAADPRWGGERFPPPPPGPTLALRDTVLADTSLCVSNC